VEVRFEFDFEFLGCVKGKDGMGRMGWEGRKTNLSVDMVSRKTSSVSRTEGFGFSMRGDVRACIALC
jgi:hypothetical protein